MKRINGPIHDGRDNEDLTILFHWAHNVANVLNVNADATEREHKEIMEIVTEHEQALNDLTERVESNRKRIRAIDGGSNTDENFIVGELTHLGGRIDKLRKELDMHFAGHDYACNELRERVEALEAIHMPDWFSDKEVILQLINSDSPRVRKMARSWEDVFEELKQKAATNPNSTEDAIESTTLDDNCDANQNSTDDTERTENIPPHNNTADVSVRGDVEIAPENGHWECDNCGEIWDADELFGGTDERGRDKTQAWWCRGRFTAKGCGEACVTWHPHPVDDTQETIVEMPTIDQFLSEKYQPSDDTQRTENGRYECRCCHCGETFYSANKREVCCPNCYTDDTQEREGWDKGSATTTDDTQELKPLPGDIDEEILPLVKALHDAGIETVASCSGHGKRFGNIALRDGRELLIAKDFDEARKLDAYWNTRPIEDELRSKLEKSYAVQWRLRQEKKTIEQELRAEMDDLKKTIVRQDHAKRNLLLEVRDAGREIEQLKESLETTRNLHQSACEKLDDAELTKAAIDSGKLKAANERLKKAVDYWYSMRRHKKSDKDFGEHAMQLADENKALKADLAAAQEENKHLRETFWEQRQMWFSEKADLAAANEKIERVLALMQQDKDRLLSSSKRPDGRYELIIKAINCYLAALESEGEENG